MGINRDIRDYRSLSFWIRSPQRAGAKIGLAEARDGSSPKFAKPLREYLPGGTGDDWRQVVIPLEDFPRVQMERVASLVFEVGVPTAGNKHGDTVFLDDIRLPEANSESSDQMADMHAPGAGDLRLVAVGRARSAERPFGKACC